MVLFAVQFLAVVLLADCASPAIAERDILLNEAERLGIALSEDELRTQSSVSEEVLSALGEDVAVLRENFRKDLLAEKFREGGAADFDALWAESVKGMAYIGFLSEMLEPEALVREFVREAGNGLGADGIAALERMAAAAGDYSQIERDCVSALAKMI